VNGYSLPVLDEEAGAELAAGADDDPSELDFDPPSPEDVEEESLLPSILLAVSLERLSEEEFDAEGDL
jgi:hypothetical protein